MKNDTLLTKLFKLNVIFTTKEAEAVGISKYHLKRFEQDGEIGRFGTGRSGVQLWNNENYSIDPFFGIQLRYPKAVISGRTALSWWHLIDRQFNYLDLTVPKGYRLPNQFGGYIVSIHHVALEYYKVGLTTVRNEEDSGDLVIYEPERALIDAFRFKTIAEYDRNQAVRNYFQSDFCDPQKLFRYIEKFPGLADLKKITEVLSN
ncbi:type IV toxin-antitoxin system AbiEi family antitoxin domain-containing protein [Lactiplantibacillus sp. WILCCON 0030]|uniref:Type IV toxin-antitoxin system AbiEi family antitoxin domain-containing protein n=1 Tax=Lactiplantibacillus brownii TaxID=3069269 RepID=A0ABU1A7Q0_9LACO|nr:type IV toxin-antitoxin system AbiEi family antitoxin domain-containing protein [Lactiplantibacillus brownii]MDQ7936690.1 type IV toxin-antitoxin system AbiEi family antitoxin domain-containing protein [Lactiplantibacillus brownii]